MRRGDLHSYLDQRIDFAFMEWARLDGGVASVPEKHQVENKSIE